MITGQTQSNACGTSTLSSPLPRPLCSVFLYVHLTIDVDTQQLMAKSRAVATPCFCRRMVPAPDKMQNLKLIALALPPPVFWGVVGKGRGGRPSKGSLRVAQPACGVAGSSAPSELC